MSIVHKSACAGGILSLDTQFLFFVYLIYPKVSSDQFGLPTGCLLLDSVEGPCDPGSFKSGPPSLV
jgi:hypothetical protein